jgi:hypothetical protein
VEVHDREADAFDGVVFFIELEEVGSITETNHIDVFVDLKERTPCKRSFERIILNQ